MRCSNDEVVVIDKRGDGVPGRCCDKFHCELKQKKSDCFVNGVYYHDGEQWNINDSSCETCLCTNGVKLCRKMECQPVTEHCTWIGITDGNCCPICLGCKEDDGRQYSIGEDWIKDDCTNCTCDESFKSSCQRSLCSLSCENPRKVKGQCCPVCDGKFLSIWQLIFGDLEQKMLKAYSIVVDHQKETKYPSSVSQIVRFNHFQ